MSKNEGYFVLFNATLTWLYNRFFAIAYKSSSNFMIFQCLCQLACFYYIEVFYSIVVLAKFSDISNQEHCLVRYTLQL